MYGKPYHKMPVSSWMIPGGNRDKKTSLMKAQKYPMSSAIQKNLGRPLSEVFFSFLTPQQKDFIGYTPKLKGPGEDLWVSPSDILRNHVIMKPPYTSRLKQALTHEGISKLGKKVEEKLLNQYREQIMKEFEKKDKELREEMEDMIRDAVLYDRELRKEINDSLLKQASNDLVNCYQKIMSETVSQLLDESLTKLKVEVDKKQREMEEELCQAVNQRSDYLAKQYDFRLAWRENELVTKHENTIRRLQKRCTARIEKASAQFSKNVKIIETQMAADQNADLIMHSAERMFMQRQELKNMEFTFADWFMKNFDTEIVKRDFIVLEMESAVRSLQEKCEKRENQLREVFRHFQKFINYVLKEKPGQAEFMLSLEKELQTFAMEESEEETEVMTRLIIDYILKAIHEKKAHNIFEQARVEKAEMDSVNFREKLQEKKGDHMLNVVGEENAVTQDETKFKEIEKKSLEKMFSKNPSLVPLLKKQRTNLK